MDHRVLLVWLSLCSSGFWAEGAHSHLNSQYLWLVGEKSLCAGQVQIKHRGEWRPVFSKGRWANLLSSQVCEELDCGSAVSSEITSSHLKRKVRVICPKYHNPSSSLRDHAWLSMKKPSSKRLRVICADSVRLVGTTRCSGRLEVNTKQSWSSVCEGDLDQQDAEVVCRELGCGTPLVFQGALYGEAEGPVRSREFWCKGHESRLLDCAGSNNATQNCSADRAVGLACSESQYLRLVGEESLCAGELQIKHRGEWRPVRYRRHWDEVLASRVCRQLDCGSAVSTEVRHLPSNRPVWTINGICARVRPVLWDCVRLEDKSFPTEIQVACSSKSQLLRHRGSDLLIRPNISVSSIIQSKPGGSHAFLWFSFNVTCVVQQYPGGSFQLHVSTSNSTQDYTQPAVAHAAHFLFDAASYANQGNYTCIYHNNNNAPARHFSSRSQPLRLIVSGFFRDLIVAVVIVLGLVVINMSVYFYHMNKAQKWMDRSRHANN